MASPVNNNVPNVNVPATPAQSVNYVDPLAQTSTTELEIQEQQQQQQQNQQIQNSPKTMADASARRDLTNLTQVNKRA